MNRWRATILAALVTLAAAVLFGPARAQAAWPAPGTPAGVSYSTTALALSWSPVWGAPRYLVKYSTSKSWTSPRYLRSTRPDAELAGLKPGTRYFVKVAVTTTSGAKLSGYGRSAEVSTGGYGSGYVKLAPGGLELRSRDADSVTLGWRGRSGAARYQIQYANNSRLSRAHFAGTTATTVKITGLKKSTNYWFRIRTKSSKGVATSTFSPARQLRTTSGEAFAPLRAATYNVMCANCSSSHPWAKRRAGLVKAIKAQDLDVLGVQEASQGLTVGADGTSKAQFDDLLDLLGKGYALTNTYRYNCARSTSPNNCDPTDRGASNDVRIIYNVHRVDLLGQGSVRFKAQDPGSPSRFLAWARLRQVSTGKKFFVVNTHLDPSDDASRSTYHYNLRAAQTRELLAAVRKNNPAKLPVLILGDFKSSKYATPSNAPYDLITGTGYVDPLGNTYRSTIPDRSATVQQRVGTEYNTKNNLAAEAPRSKYINGSVIDYIYTSDEVAVVQWQTVVDVTSSGKFSRTPPSDHNMVRVTVYLP